jgi:ERCC4-type nuclease
MVCNVNVMHRSPHATGDIFRLLMQGQESVDVEKAVAVGSDNLLLSTGQSASREGGAGADNTMDAERDARAAAIEILHQLPGVTHNNARALMSLASSVAELATKTEAELAPILGQSGAKKMIAFFKQRIFRE